MTKQSWKGAALLNPVPPVLVSCGSVERPNLITVGWAGTVCTRPAMVSISLRPERYSYGLIKESGLFAVNLPTEALVRAVDWCGVRSGRDVDKFAALGLHAAAGSAHPACPVLEESPLTLECRVTQTIPLGSHELFLAEVAGCLVDEARPPLPGQGRPHRLQPRRIPRLGPPPRDLRLFGQEKEEALSAPRPDARRAGRHSAQPARFVWICHHTAALAKPQRFSSSALLRTQICSWSA